MLADAGDLQEVAIFDPFQIERIMDAAEGRNEKQQDHAHRHREGKPAEQGSRSRYGKKRSDRCARMEFHGSPQSIREAFSCCRSAAPLLSFRSASLLSFRSASVLSFRSASVLSFRSAAEESASRCGTATSCNPR